MLDELYKKTYFNLYDNLIIWLLHLSLIIIFSKCVLHSKIPLCLRLCLVPVKYFLENTYFPEMLFSGKENIFKCLVVFGKILWKIFSGVWLCCWKYHRKYIFYILLTFSQIFSAAKQIYNFIPQSRNTNNTQKKKFIIRLRLGSTTGEIARSRLGSTTGEIAIEDNDLVWGRSVLGCDAIEDDDLGRGRSSDAVGDDDLGWGRSSDAVGDDDFGRGRSVLGCDAVRDDDLSRALLGFLGSSSLYLSVRTGASPSHSAFSLFSENTLKWKWKRKIISGSKE